MKETYGKSIVMMEKGNMVQKARQMHNSNPNQKNNIKMFYLIRQKFRVTITKTFFGLA